VNTIPSAEWTSEPTGEEKALTVRVIVEGEVSREPKRCADNGEIWWAVVSLDARPDYWGRPTRAERTVFRIRTRSHELNVSIKVGDVVRVAGILYLWGWYDRSGSYRHVAEVVGDAVELVERAFRGKAS
jgi:hypothetical protein